jgi:hypothetical protein
MPFYIQVTILYNTARYSSSIDYRQKVPFERLGDPKADHYFSRMLGHSFSNIQNIARIQHDQGTESFCSFLKRSVLDFWVFLLCSSRKRVVQDGNVIQDGNVVLEGSTCS